MLLQFELEDLCWNLFTGPCSHRLSFRQNSFFLRFCVLAVLCLHFVVAAGDDGNSLSTAAFAPFDSRSAQTMLAVVLALVRFFGASRASLAMNVV